VGMTGTAPPAGKRTAGLGSLNRAVSYIEQGFNFVTALLIIFLIFFSTAAVFSRYLFNYPLKGYEDFAEMIMVVMVFFSLSYTQWAGEHVRLELFIDQLKGRRIYHVIELVNTVFSLFVFAIIAAYAFKGTLESRAYHDVSMTIYWPIWPAKLMLAMGSLLLCARFIVQFFQQVDRVRAGAAPEARSRDLDREAKWT